MTKANQDLMSAAQRGDVEGIRQAIGNGADLEARDSYGQTPLHMAVVSAAPADPIRYGSSDAVGALLEAGAEVDALDEKGSPPLAYAITGAARSDDPSVQMLLDAGADPDIENLKGNTPRGIVERSPNYRNSGLLDESVRESRSSLHHAAEDGDTEEVGRLLEAGTGPDITDKVGFTPLHAAVNGANTDTARQLLYAGADPNSLGGAKSMPALLTAMTIRDKLVRDTIIELLIEAGADPDLGMEGGRSAREIAQIRGDISFS
ncbi:MAG: hypothetical protein GEU79_09690 [Acidimicrobiia bacterium]|nr:hypothetical protein [Acidimicrobiia bacterium]